MKVYLSGAFGGVQELVFDNGGTYTVPLGVHAHANWAFSAEGVYRVTTTQTVTLAGGRSSDTETLTIAVGNVDPASAVRAGSGCGTISNAVLGSDDVDAARRAAEQAAAEAAAAARGAAVANPTRVGGDGVTGRLLGALTGDDPVPRLLAVLGGLLLTGSAGTGALWWRSRHTGTAA